MNSERVDYLDHFFRLLTDQPWKLFQALPFSFVRCLFSGSSNLCTSLDQHNAFILSDDILQKFTSISHLNDIYEQVRGNDRLFLEKIQSLLHDLDKENSNQSNQGNPPLTLQSQMMLARNLTHTFTNNDQMKQK